VADEAQFVLLAQDLSHFGDLNCQSFAAVVDAFLCLADVGSADVDLDLMPDLQALLQWDEVIPVGLKAMDQNDNVFKFA
jgi:hypothetical protein